MANHLVEIELIDNDHAVPPPKNNVMTLGDTVEYETIPKGLPFRLVFENGSPFSDTTIQTRGPHDVVNDGVFFCMCFITPPGMNEVGWRENEVPESGGDHDVRPRS